MDVWDRPGYPDRVTEPSLVGTAVHEGVEAILRALKASGCTSLADERAVAALRSLGGYTAIAVAAIQTALASLGGNPRMNQQVGRLGERLERRTPEMRRSIQALVARTPVVPDDPPASASSQVMAAGGRARVGPGAHPEVTLVGQDDRFMGRIDLLTVHTDHADILDFKTGQPAEHHLDQVALYGLLWMLDKVANPDGLPVGSLRLAYIGRDQPVPVPRDWKATRRGLKEWIRSADRALAHTPPEAMPSTECQRCPVRHMCDEYWDSEYATREAGSTFVDAEVVVLRQNGPRSWSARLVRGSGDVLLRTTTEDEAIEPGQRLRVLDAAAGQVEDESWTVITITGGSEMYCVARS